MSEPRPGSVTVRIAGDEHVIRSSAEPGHTRRCATLLDERIARIREQGGPADPGRAVVLAALSLTDELLRLEEAHARLQEEVRDRAEGLARRIEAALAGQPDLEGGSGGGAGSGTGSGGAPGSGESGLADV